MALTEHAAAQPAGDAPSSRHVVGMRVDATSYDDAVARVLAWSHAGIGRYVCISTVHMAMEARDDESFRDIVNAADLVTPDGMPLVWSLRALGLSHASRVCGPDLTPALCAAAARQGVPVGFYGGTPAVMERLMEHVRARWPALSVAYQWCPPFCALTAAEDARVVADITASGTRILFVGIGCPKQERWMAAHKDTLPCVMLGVGAAFDFMAGAKSRAPGWMQQSGLEWVHRLASVPGRLGWRYLYNNPRFLALFARQLAGRL